MLYSYGIRTLSGIIEGGCGASVHRTQPYSRQWSFVVHKLLSTWRPEKEKKKWKHSSVEVKIIVFVLRTSTRTSPRFVGIDKNRIAYKYLPFVLSEDWWCVLPLSQRNSFMMMHHQQSGKQKKPISIAYGHSRDYFFSVFLNSSFVEFNICHRNCCFSLCQPETKHFLVCRFHRLPFSKFILWYFFSFSSPAGAAFALWTHSPGMSRMRWDTWGRTQIRQRETAHKHTDRMVHRKYTKSKAIH